MGNFRLAVGYASIFWPKFVEFEKYIFTENEFSSEESVRAFESEKGSTPKSVERVMNHLHIAEIQHLGCKDISKDKLIMIGNILKEIYQATLFWLFPGKPCVVEFYQPEDPDDLMEYQISFWQKKHDPSNA